MIKTFSAAGFCAAILLSVGAVAHADEYYAAPINSGPPTTSIPVAHELLNGFNAVTSPILQPILAPGGAAAPEPVWHHHHHHHHHHHM